VNRFAAGKGIKSSRFFKYYTGHRACHGCRIACRHEYQVQDRAGNTVSGVGPEYGTVGAFGPVCGVGDPQAMLLVNDLCNRYGLDTSSTGNIIGWAMELWQRGIIGPEDTGGLALEWGDVDAVLELVEQIAHARGFGAVLALGPAEAARRIGKDAERYLIMVKGLLQSDSVDVRAYKGFALGVATSTRGADHLRSRPTMEALHLPAERLRELYGAEVDPDPTSITGKARMVWQCEREYALADALGVCRFAQRFNSPDHLDPSELRRLTELATGLEFSDEAFLRVGERITALDRCFLAREGVGREQDTLPARYMEEPMPEGGYAGQRLTREELDAMLDDYYALHGWDAATGRPLPETLRALDLDPDNPC
jgi:aldehyde:ferredoxin oxidoreductase